MRHPRMRMSAGPEANCLLRLRDVFEPTRQRSFVDAAGLLEHQIGVKMFVRPDPIEEMPPAPAHVAALEAGSTDVGIDAAPLQRRPIPDILGGIRIQKLTTEDLALFNAAGQHVTCRLVPSSPCEGVLNLQTPPAKGGGYFMLVTCTGPIQHKITRGPYALLRSSRG